MDKIDFLLGYLTGGFVTWAVFFVEHTIKKVKEKENENT